LFFEVEFLEIVKYAIKMAFYMLYSVVAVYLKHGCRSTVRINCSKCPSITMVAYDHISANTSNNI